MLLRAKRVPDGIVCSVAERRAGDVQCRRRWQNYLNATVKKGSWSPEVRPVEDCGDAWA